jgi:HSP20 family molecular chaperone IbpA
MAQDKRPQNEQALQRQGEGTRAWLESRDPFADFWSDLFGMRRFNSPIDRWLGSTRPQGLWAPQVETFQRGDQFVVRADLPGLCKENINVDVTDDAITIQGERRDEHEEEQEGYYRSERSYGKFYRVIPLPEGAIGESAKADFNNGVLEVTIQAPPKEVRQRRKIEISEDSQANTADKSRSTQKSTRQAQEK